MTCNYDGIVYTAHIKVLLDINNVVAEIVYYS